ncbi:glycosyltransferase family 4 protein [Porticoccaceae bacterium LTM1]|nr:glycosyltransferase family 4 protein [Porticoccaceae bacterium LTM1]
MHILFLTDNFPPEGNAPATRTYEHAREWVKAGHRVTVITGVPNFPEGKVFDGYQNKWYQKECVEGIEVRRVKTFITANEGFVKRTLDFMSFMVTGFIAGLFVKRPDVVVATSPQFFCAIAGWLLSALRRKPFIFELRDIWPASITAVGAMERSIVIRFLEKLEMFLYKRADHIISVTHAFKKELGERGIDTRKISVVLNGVDLSKYEPQPKDVELSNLYNLNGKFVAGYIGTHGMAHALETIVEAAERLQKQQDIVFLFAGGGAAVDNVKDLVEAKGLTNVRMLGRQDKSLMPKIWSLCDVSVVHLKDVPLFTSVIPSKIFESMGMGLPILIGVPEGEATEIVVSSGAGIAIAPENSDVMAESILQFYLDKECLSALSENSLRAASQYSRRALANSMLESLEKVVKPAVAKSIVN